MTPLTKNFFSPSKKNFAFGTNSQGFVLCHVGVLSCHSERSEESRIISHTQPTKQQPEMFRFAQHDRKDNEWRREALNSYSAFNASRTTAPVSLDVSRRVRGRDEASLKLRRREIDAALQTSVKKTARTFSDRFAARSRDRQSARQQRTNKTSNRAGET